MIDLLLSPELGSFREKRSIGTPILEVLEFY